jgi:hypothetical protein
MKTNGALILSLAALATNVAASPANHHNRHARRAVDLTALGQKRGVVGEYLGRKLGVKAEADRFPSCSWR